MGGRTRTPKEQADLEAAVRPDTSQLFRVIGDNAKFMAESRLGQTQIVTAIAGLDRRMGSVEDLTRQNVNNSGRLVELSEQRSKREELEFEARLARERASQEASVRRTAAEISEAAAAGTWRRSALEKLLLPIGTAIAGAILAWTAARFGQPAPLPTTQTVTVESQEPRAVVEPEPAAPLPEEPPSSPEPEHVPPSSGPPRPARPRHPDLLEFEQ